jgi:isoquinoline 1-oxidoreductase beta subunit
VFGATLVKFDGSKAKQIPGVTDVVKMKNGVAVLAKNTWAARRGRDAIEAQWNTAQKDQFSDESLMKDYKEFAKKPSIQVQKDEAAAAKLAQAKRVLTAEYEFPFLAHAAMEPMNCTVNYDGHSAEIWSGHQMPTADRMVAAQILGLPPEKIKVNTVYAGGSFGRRGSKMSDYAAEACEIAKLVKKPIKVTWTREDDMRGGFYRPMFFHQARIATDAHGMPEAWHHTIVGQSILKGTAFEGMMRGSPVDPVAVEGVHESAYHIPGIHIDLELPTLDVPSLWWRSVGNTHTAYVMETLIDELAVNAKIDALKYRRQLLTGKARHMAVLDLLAKHSPWGKPAMRGHAYGLAVHESFNSVVGHVVEVSIQDGKPKVHRVWSAVHCGRVVNPDGARTQVEGAIAYGLSAALYGRIKFEKGRVITGNFNDYQVLRMNEMPKIEVFFARSEDPPTGLGEPGLPPLAPAVANAVFKLTGKRVRKLPFDLT